MGEYVEAYTLTRLDQAREALISGDQLECMKILNEVIRKHETMHKAFEDTREEYERQHHGTDTGATTEQS